MKNTISILLFLLAISNLCHAQSMMDKPQMTKPDLNTFVSAKPVIPAQTPLSDDCKRYKRMKNAGIGLTAGGGAFFIIGIAMVAAGEHNAANASSANSYGQLYADGSNDTGLVGGGGAMIAIGLVGMGAGIPLAVIGTRRYKDACTSATLELHSGGHGTGIALNF